MGKQIRMHLIIDVQKNRVFYLLFMVFYNHCVYRIQLLSIKNKDKLIKIKLKFNRILKKLQKTIVKNLIIDILFT
jgi:hypothetical protein